MRVVPTKGFLLEFKKRLSLIQTAHRLLEKKRDELVKNLKQRINELSKIRAEVLNLFKTAFIRFLRVYSLVGRETISHATAITRGKLKVRILPRIIMGVPTPTLKIEEKPKSGLVMPPLVREIADELYKILDAMFKLIIFEVSVEYITNDLKRTNRIVNVLEKVLIPRMKEQLRKLSEIVEELEVEEFIRTKIVRDIIARRRGE